LRVELPERDIEEYRGIVGEYVDVLKEEAEDLKGLKVIHVNSTSYGGGVAELLKGLVPLMRSLGLKAEWEVIEAPGEFFNVTKKIHNGLQGGDVEITEEEWSLYERVNERNSVILNLSADVVVIHDPQPAMIPCFLDDGRKWIWRCHIDLSNPNEALWERFKGYLGKYGIMLFHLKDYIKEEFAHISGAFPPSIDPISDKNREIEEEIISQVLKRYGIEKKKTITVVARFDPWKDLMGAIDVYRLVKEKMDVQLLIVSAMASDDPEGWIFFEKVARHAGEDEDIHFLTNIKGVGDIEVNVFQRIADVGLHTATREGFGLVISEIMWKEKPVVGRPSGGVKIQVDDGINGYLEWDIDDLAERVLELLEDEEKRYHMGKKAKEKVKENFLITSHLMRYLKVFKEVL